MGVNTFIEKQEKYARTHCFCCGKHTDADSYLGNALTHKFCSMKCVLKSVKYMNIKDKIYVDTHFK